MGAGISQEETQVQESDTEEVVDTQGEGEVSEEDQGM